MALPGYFEAIEKHLGNFIEEDESLVFDEISSPDFHLDVYWIKPNEYRRFNILLTNGVSYKEMNTPNDNIPQYVELAMILPEKWKLNENNFREDKYGWPICELKKLGRYVHENNTWYGVGHTIPTSKSSIVGKIFQYDLLTKSKSLPMDF